MEQSNLPQPGKSHILTQLNYIETGLNRFLPETNDEQVMSWWNGLSFMWKQIFWINLYFERTFSEKENIWYIIQMVEGILNRYRRRTQKDFDPVVLESVTVDDIRAMRDMKVLDCASNGLRDISPLREVNIQYLDMSSNLISDLSPLVGKRALKKLDVNNNPTRDKTNVIGTLLGLEILWINQTSIEMTAARFHPLKNLHFLRLSRNRISDNLYFSELASLETIICNRDSRPDPCLLQKRIPSLRQLDVPSERCFWSKVPENEVVQFAALNPHVKITYSTQESE